MRPLPPISPCQALPEERQHMFLELLEEEALRRPVADPHRFVAAWLEDYVRGRA